MGKNLVGMEPGGGAQETIRGVRLYGSEGIVIGGWGLEGRMK